MRTVLVAFLLMVHSVIAQDSLSRQYLSYVNMYRLVHNLPLLEYDMQLDSLALVRLIESAKGVDDCFEESEFKGLCKDGIRNLHFKFKSNTEDFHNNTNRIFVLGENMVAAPEYCTFQRGFSLGGTPISISETIHIKNGKNVANPAKKFLGGWIKSPGHNQILLAVDATLCAFKIYRTMHNNKQWLHGVFLIAKNR